MSGVKCLRGMVPLILLLLATQALADEPSCDSKVYCQGNLLHTVQMERIFPDSKSFVDMKIKTDEATTLADFDKFMKENDQKPTKEQIKQFVADHFEEGNELEDYTPGDLEAEPKLLNRIEDSEIRTFAKDIIGIWPQLSKKVKKEVHDNPAQYSFIPVDNGFVIPGGRFREFYYWDSFWIIRGLILSEMYATAGGMIDNYLEIVDKYGFLPNGARVYYLNRSQPPLLTLMVLQYFQATNDESWLKKAVPILVKEMNFWLKNRSVKFKKDNKERTLCHYAVESGSPRPESYYEDFTTASVLSEEAPKKQLYCDLKSAAESGWDFSTRWLFDENGGNNGSLSSIQTRRVIPVDLNSFLAQAFLILSGFFEQLKDQKNAKVWKDKALLWQETIEDVFWCNEEGTWFDYDIAKGESRKEFHLSNIAPLAAEAYNPKKGQYLGERTVDYIEKLKLLDYKGGVPTSLIESGQQWDFPNVWPPLQWMVVFGLENTGNEKAKHMAKQLAERTVDALKIGFKKYKQLFEKYDANTPGQFGGGGEYTVQSGFGWTIGTGLAMIDKYYTKDQGKGDNSKEKSGGKKLKGGDKDKNSKQKSNEKDGGRSKA